MAPVGPVQLADVIALLTPRLTQLHERPAGSRGGRVFVGTTDGVRGLAFDVVFVPGLAERLFPKKVVEDPILLDSERPDGLARNRDRIARERRALEQAVGSAGRRLILSWPRLDLEQGRPRVPSFYALEVVRAAEGALPGYEALARRAEHAAKARIAWPAPHDPRDAIDHAEYDLAVLDRLVRSPEQGHARYLLTANPHLTRALRARGRRWSVRKFTPADGLVDPTLSQAALAAHALANRSWSPTALQALATCPYRFLLYAIHKLEPREVPESIEEIDPLSKGSLMHEVLFRLHLRLRNEGLLPVTPSTLDAARTRLDDELDSVAAKWREDLSPAIDRLWDDGVAEMRSDLREWLRRSSEESRWTPWRFELAFGLPASDDRDPASTEEPAVLANGLRVRGSVDLAERMGDQVRATDYKTGRARRSSGVVIGGGEVLQPALYGLVLEVMFPELRVSSGRLYYCTATGGFSEVEVPLDATARSGIDEVATLLEHALSTGFFPAAPRKDACDWCAYLPVCGSAESRRVARKNPAQLAPWRKLRERE